MIEFNKEELNQALAEVIQDEEISSYLKELAGIIR